MAATEKLYKVLPADVWRGAVDAGQFAGAGIDLTDGFIHLSSADQVVPTVALHFAGQTDLVLVAIDAERLAPSLRWETSRGGALFPHVYGVIPMDAVLDARPLPLGGDGVHAFPEAWRD